MKQSNPESIPGSARVFVACLLSFAILITPIAAIAAPRARTSPIVKKNSAPAERKEAKTALAERDLAPAPVPEPAIGPVIVANLTDIRPGVDPASAKPGETINYTVTIQNTGDQDATTVQFNDDVDVHTAYVSGSGLLAMADSYNTIGDVQISVPAPGVLTNDLDITAGNNTGMTTTAQTVSSTQCAACNNVTINADGSFTYDPKAGFTGTDSFTYTAKNAANKTASATVQITVTGKIWFINNNAGACVSSCDGRLSHPFQTLAAFQAVNLGGVGQPQDGDVIFLYESATNYIGPVTLRTNQKFIGQDATATLISLSGFTQPSGTDPLPTMNTGGNAVSITSAANAINLGTGAGNANLLRGFTVGTTTGAKISGSTFGTLTAGNNTTPDVTLNGGGQALSLTTGAFAATSGFVSVASTSSAVGTSGILLSSVTGTVSFGPTTISGSANEGIKITGSSVAATFGTTGVTSSGTQGISISTATGNIVFGDTSVTNGIEGVSLTNNSAGTRTFGALTVTGSSAGAFIHSTGGGDVNITGIASLSCAGNAISVSAPVSGDLIDFQAATSATVTAAGPTGVNWTGAAGAAMTFSALTIQTNAGIGLNASGGGTITVTNGTGTINNTAQAASAIVANGITFNANFSAVKSTGGTSGISLTSVAGTSTFGTSSTLSGSTNATFLVNGGTAAVTYSGNITQATVGQPAVSISNGHATGAITFQTGTISATNGTGLQFDNADGTYNFNTTAGTTTLAGGDAGVDILNGSAGTFTFGRGATPTSFVITSPTGIGFNVDGGATTSTANVTYNGNITYATTLAMVNVTNHNTGTITFQNGTLNATGGTGLQFSNADSTTSYNFNGTTTLNGGDAGIDILTGSDGTFTFASGTTITRANSVAGTAFNLASSNATVTYNGAMTLGTATGSMVAIDNHDANIINFNTGNLTKGSSTTVGITITNCGAGTINFNNPTIGITMTTGKAVNLGTNTGSAINFTPAGGGSGIDLTSTTATTFDATGGGTISVTGSGNTLSATAGGTALNVNATTIGAGGLTFESISATTASANAGIILNNTGVSAGLTVTGISTTAGTGGTISSRTTNGISLTTTRNISLSNMNLTNNAQTQSSTNVACGNNLVAGDTTLCTSNLWMNGVTTISLTNLSISGSTQEGISGTAVSGLTLTNSTIESNGNEDYENGLLFKNLTGTVTITNNNIRNNFSRQAHIFNDGASALTLNVTGTLFGRTVAPGVSSQQGLLMELQGTSATNVDVGTSSFNNNGNGNGFQINSASSATVGSAGTHSSIHNSTSMTNNAAHVFANTSGSSTMFFDTMNNTAMTAAVLQSIDYFANGGNLTGVIQGNTIGTNGVAASGCATALGGCDGMTIDKALAGNLSLRIESNTIQQINTNGIALGGANNTGSINASIINNTIRQPSNTAPANSQGNAMFLNIGTVNPSAFTACLNITGNTIQDTATKTWDINGSAAFMYVRSRNTAIVRIPGAAAGSAAAADTFLEANNTFTRNFNPTYERVLTEALTGGTFANGAACTVPLLLADGGVSSAFRAPSALSILAFSSYAGPDYDEAGSLATAPNTVTASLNQAQLDSIVSAAIARWSDTGLTPAQIAAMRAINFDVADLSSGYLGEAANNHILIDRNAGGKGWFVDRTPQDDSEFGNVTSSTRRYTNPANAPAGHIDLLTAIEHEIGHKLGLGDSYLTKDRDNLMYGYLTVGERRSPAKGQASEARSSASAAVHHLLLGFDDQKSIANSKSGFKGLKSGIAGEKPDVSFNHATSRRVTKAATTTRSLAPAPVGCSVNPGTVCVNIGILHPGDSVQISFSVTVNNPPNLSLLTPPRVTTQGTVSGGNFVTVSTNDPDTGAANDTTDTPIDLFDVKFDSLTSSLNPSSPTDPVTYTATISVDNAIQNAGAAVPSPGSITFNDNAVAIGTCTNVAISGAGPWTAQCTIPSGTYVGGSSHPITATYNGNSNFDTKTSGTLTQTVQNCSPTPVVTKIADTNDGVCDADCSLREAIATACNTGTITFNTAGVFATPQTITLTLGELSVGGNLTIDGPDGATQRVTINGGGANRVFNINSGKTVTIRDLNIMNGLASGAFPANCGGAIYNDHATLTLIGLAVTGSTADNGGGVCNDGRTSGSASLTIIDSTFSGNTATSDGGAIHNSGLNGSATLNVTNSTISSNNANFSGGGIFTDGTGGVAPVAITNCTIAQNRSDNDTNAVGSGGGLAILGGSALTLRNSIVDLNWVGGSPSTTADDIQGAVIAGGASTHNIVGSCTACGLTDAVDNNLLNVAAATLKLATLNPNGGPVQTHALLSGSIALEAGNNAYVVAPPFLNVTPITDNRGTGYPRIADSADPDTTATVDIGAYEAHPTVEDITDKTVAEDGSTNFVFNIGDGTGALIASVTASSSNTTLVPNNVANLSVTGAGSTRTLTITPAADANSPADGTATITVTVTATNGSIQQDDFVLTVTEVNDAPAPVNDTVSNIDEDSGVYSIPIAPIVLNDAKGPANESAQTLTVTGVSSPVGGTVVINGLNFDFTPTADFSGPAGFDYTVQDNGTTNTANDFKSANGHVSFTINPINDPPSFTKGADQTVNEDAGAQTVNGWATALSRGPADESLQTLTFNVSVTGTTGNLAFSSGPAIDSSGNLTYTTSPDTNGTANISVTLSDNGSNVPPNSNTSGAQTFMITVDAVNDAPTFLLGAGPTVNEDAGAQTVNGFASSFQPGPLTATDEGTQTLVGYTLSLTGSTGGLTFSSGPAINNAGALTYTPTADTNGTATYNVVATDSGSGSAPNVNQSAPVSFTITVNAQNDNPTLTTNAGLSVINGGSGTIDNTKLKVDDIDNTAAQLVFTIGTAPVNGTLKKGVAVLAGGSTFTQDDINNNQITYQHTNLASVVDSFTFTVSDGAGGSIGLTTFNITTGCANSITVTTNADSGNGSLRQSIAAACDGATITFDMGTVVSPITLTTGELVVDKNLTIQGPTTAPLTIGGNLNSRVFHVNPGKTVSISSLTISNGRAAFGGGIYNEGTLTIIGSTINGNASANGADNGAGNGANGGDGGGLYNSGTLNVINSTISGNNAGNGGNATGGVGVGVGGNGGNGGGIYNSGTLLLINDSISQNRAGRNGLNTGGDDTNVDLGTPGQGGGMYSATTTAILRNTIIAGNLSTFFSHNIVPPGGTSAQDNDSDGGGTVDSSSSFNLIGAIDGLSGITPGTNGNQAGSAGTPLNPLFGPLTNNGGPTATYVPQQFSPAIDMGNNVLATDQNNVALTTDQRGTGFPRILNGTVDIGSVETTPPPPPPPSADLGVSKLANVDESLADRDIVYTITVINAGPDAGANVALDDTLPGTMTFVSLSSPGGWTCTTPAVGAGGNVHCTIASLPAGSSVGFTLTGHIPPGTAGGTVYHNVATVSTSTSDPNSVNDDYPADTTVATCLTNPVVISNANSGAGSLRQAIIEACDSSTITFDMNQVVSPITLTTSELLINKNLTITGPGANFLTVMRSAAGGTPQFRIFSIGSGMAVNISGLTINNGDAGAFLGGGVLNSGSLTLTASAVTGNTAIAGGGVLNSNGTMTITESTISGNTSGSGAGIVNSNNGTLTLYNSTISGNTGDGLSNVTGGVANITNNTISNNSTRGITSNAGTTNIRNTIVVNTPGNVGDVNGAFVSQGNNFIGKSDGSTGFTNLVNNDKVGTIASPLNALLAVLGNYGGPTQTHALLPGSPAIDAANNCVTDPAHCGDANIPQLTNDQRGQNRQVNGTVDIGAYESRGFTVTATSGTPQTTIVGTAFGAPLVATVSSAFGEPVNGGQVTFTAPGAGPSATFTGGVTTININIASGQASASATANAIVGGPYNVSAAGTGITGTANFSLTNIKANQTINFAAIATKTFGDADFVVSPTATSGLPVSLAASGQCTVTSPSPGTVHITAAGACTITASQAGDANYNPAANVPQSFTINKANQTINFGAIATKTFGDPDFVVSPTATSGLLVSLAASGNCTVTTPAPGTVHITGAGSCTITASQAGDANYNPATNVPQSFTINKANQTITFNALANKTFGDPDFAVVATASSALPVSFAATGNCTVTSPSQGTIHLTGAGACTITASQAGDVNYNPATNVPQSFTIAKAATVTSVSSNFNPSDLNQSVTFRAEVSSVAPKTGTVQFKDNGNNMGAPVALDGLGVALFNTSSLTAGTHTITAEYSGDANFLASTGTLSGGQVVRAQPSLSINDVSITEGNTGTKVLTFTITLSAGSNLPVSVDYATANGTATAGSDYVATNGTFTFNPLDGDVTRTVNVTINGDVGFEPDETLFVNLSNPVNATISDNQGLGTIQNDDVLGGFISFSQVNTNVNESTGIVTLTVVRTNDVSQAVNVDYATDDTGSSTNCAALNTGLASQRCDYTSVFGTLRFAANETQKTIDIPINLDAFTEGPEVFSVKLSNPTGGAVLAVPSTGTVTISDSASPAPNAIDDTTTFVRQQYRDFLNRDADAAGLAFWKDNIDKCNDPARRPAGQTVAQCIELQRITTSAAFFLSIEFKQTGGMVREFYVAALDRPASNNMPTFVEFMRDTQGIQKGVVVGQGNWQAVLDANRTAFMNEFVTRAEFVALYPTTDTPTQYVDKLYQHAAVAPVTVQERLDAIQEFNGAPTAADPGARGRALLRITQNGNFQAREANRTFVQIEYFGYLRRDPDIAGFNFWVAKLNQFNGDFLQAEMVKAFLSSLEYRGRFGP